jgi:hypothetical protein
MGVEASASDAAAWGQQAGDWEDRLYMRWGSKGTGTYTDEPEPWVPIIAKSPALVMCRAVLAITELNTQELDTLKGDISQSWSPGGAAGGCQCVSCYSPVACTSVLHRKGFGFAFAFWLSHMKCALWPMVAPNFWKPSFPEVRSLGTCMESRGQVDLIKIYCSLPLINFKSTCNYFNT